jgi:hypothetical protein
MFREQRWFSNIGLLAVQPPDVLASLRVLLNSVAMKALEQLMSSVR